MFVFVSHVGAEIQSAVFKSMFNNINLTWTPGSKNLLNINIVNARNCGGREDVHQTVQAKRVSNRDL